jgi:hypothetical protein
MRHREAIIRKNVDYRRARIEARRKRPDEDLDREALAVSKASVIPCP